RSKPVGDNTFMGSSTVYNAHVAAGPPECNSSAARQGRVVYLRQSLAEPQHLKIFSKS
ncbi:hypothetical protein PanWU01x14_137110, partial [Parasponia andersonii]